MLSMLSKARRAAGKRISSTDDNNSDSRSIASVSKEDKKVEEAQLQNTARFGEVEGRGKGLSLPNHVS